MFHMSQFQKIIFSLPKLGGATRTDCTTSSAASKSIKVKEPSDFEKKKFLYSPFKTEKQACYSCNCSGNFQNCMFPWLKQKKNS